MPLVSQAATLPEALEVPGGVSLIDVEARNGSAPEVRFNGARVSVIDGGDCCTAVVGIPLTTAPGEQWLELSWPSGDPARRGFTVTPKDYQTQYITIEDERKVEPLPADLERIYREQAITEQVLSSWREQAPDFGFVRPVEGPVSSVYGLRRFFNNQPRSPHSGVDIAAAKGTPIRAPAKAVVLHAGEFFFSGNVVYLGHGQGLVTMYAHMDEIEVEPGENVAQGQIIGRVGATGRVTGPHLHWGVYLNRTPVDPDLFVPHG